MIRSEQKVSEEPQFATYTRQEQIAERPQGSVSKKLICERSFSKLPQLLTATRTDL